jgi:DNA modification methylase
MIPLYQTNTGILYYGDSQNLLEDSLELKEKVNLIFTSPPFPLNKKKAYGNLTGKKYIDWLSGFGEIFSQLLTPDGSIVIEIGNAWEKGYPTMSLLPIETLIEFKKKGDFHLCQEFIWNNPARLPSPAQWVNVERIRVKDAFTRLWWLSKKPKPKANNRNVLVEYSKSMKRLLEKQSYNAGRRPSEHNIGETSFLKDNGGAIPSNVITLSNTNSSDPYLKYCKEKGFKYHPARMPIDLAKFFIKFLTDDDDLVLDPFAGSNITGFAAESLSRRWVGVEKDLEYAISSKCRFDNAKYTSKVKLSEN